MLRSSFKEAKDLLTNNETHARMRTHPNAHTDTQTYTHTHTHTHARARTHTPTGQTRRAIMAVLLILNNEC